MLQMTKDQDVTTALYAYLADKKWKGVVILGGIGSVTSMTVANPISHGSPPKIGIKKLDQTYVHELKGTNLKGAALLGNNKELTTEDTLMKFLMGREKDRGAVVTKKRGFTSPYYIDLLRFGAPPP